MATPAPVSIAISVMQMVAGSSQHMSHRFSVSSEKLEQTEVEISHELSVAEEEEEEKVEVKKRQTLA